MKVDQFNKRFVENHEFERKLCWFDDRFNIVWGYLDPVKTRPLITDKESVSLHKEGSDESEVIPIYRLYHYVEAMKQDKTYIEQRMIKDKIEYHASEIGSLVRKLL